MVTDRHLQPTLEVSESDFDKCFAVNVKGVFFGTSIILPRLLEQGRGGSIINIASVGATRPRPGLVWYNSSKGAIWNVSLRARSITGNSPIEALMPGNQGPCSRIWTTQDTSKFSVSSSWWDRPVSKFLG